MKKISIVYYIIFALLSSSVAIAQPAMQEPSQTEYISNRTANLLDNQNDFLKGSILSKGKTIASNQILRYNVSKEEFEIKDPKSPDSKILKTILRSEDIMIQIGDDTFEYISSEKNRLRGYFIPLFKGDKNSVYKKIKKEYIAAQRAVNSMTSDVAALYDQNEFIYLVDSKGTFTELESSKKGRLNAFGPMKKKVKEYTKKNKLNLKKEPDLIQVVTYIDSL